MPIKHRFEAGKVSPTHRGNPTESPANKTESDHREREVRKIGFLRGMQIGSLCRIYVEYGRV